MSTIFGRVMLSVDTATHTLCVYRNTEWNEWVAVVYHRPTGVAVRNATIVSTYYADSAEDAISTGGKELHHASRYNTTTALDPSMY